MDSSWRLFNPEDGHLPLPHFLPQFLTAGAGTDGPKALRFGCLFVAIAANDRPGAYALASGGTVAAALCTRPRRFACSDVTSQRGAFIGLGVFTAIAGSRQREVGFARHLLR